MATLLIVLLLALVSVIVWLCWLRLRNEAGPHPLQPRPPVPRMPPRPVMGPSRTQLQAYNGAAPVLTAFWQTNGIVGLRAFWADKELLSLNGGVSFHVVQRENMRILGDAKNFLHLIPPVRGLRDIMAYAANQRPLSLRSHSKGQLEELLAEEGILFEPEEPTTPRPPAG